jgi:hypothetical protein
VAAFVQAAVRRAVPVVVGRLPDYPVRRRTSKEVASITMLGWTRSIPVLAAQFTYRRFADLAWAKRSPCFVSESALSNSRWLSIGSSGVNCRRARVRNLRA